MTLGAAVAAAVGWVLRASRRTGTGGSGMLPSVGSDTWPPVPTNPDRVS